MPPGQVGYEVSVTGKYRHIAPGSSEVCWDIQTTPARPNAQVTVQTSGAGVVSGGFQTVNTNSSGFVRVRVRINSYGSYSSSTNVSRRTAQPGRATATVTVTSAPGTCPPP